MGFLGLNIMALFAGYTQPLDTMKSWVYKWIYYISPVTYAQEALMLNQYAGVDLACAPQHLIPSVPGATIENQVCFFPGAEAQSATVSGSKFLNIQLGYESSHLWRNYGIIWVFIIGYITLAMIGVEYLSWGSGGGSTKIFIKPSKKATPKELPTVEPKPATEKATNSDGLEPIKTSKSVIRGRASIMTWQNVNYFVPIPGDTPRNLLNNVSGYVKPGRLTALMGPSGAGKTTLLDTLSQKSRVGVVSGDMLVDGKKLRADFQRSTGFVEQMDIHDGTATVREALQFSALLRQPASVSKEEKYKFVEEIIGLLELEHLADALIGMPGFGLSVEERKVRQILLPFLQYNELIRNSE